MFLLFNTGVVAETVNRGQDYGSSTIVNNERLAESQDPAVRMQSEGCIQCDIRVHKWTLRYGVNGTKVYDGGFAASYYWYGHSVAQLDGFVDDYVLANRSTLYQEELPADWAYVEENSYIVFTYHNYVTDWVLTSKPDPVSLQRVQTRLNESDRIYTSGHATVYRYQTSNETTAALESERREK